MFLPKAKPIGMACLLWAGMLAACLAQEAGQVVRNGIPWFDTDGNIVNAHGACLVEEAGRYYLFGEWKGDNDNAFRGFSCYSSDDLIRWTFERVALPLQPDGILGPNRVGERVKVMKCPQTGEYVMLMHADNLTYSDPCTAYATSPSLTGEYTLQGPLLYDGKPLRHWDMGTFQDTDGKGYLLAHSGPIYRLADDYHSVAAKVAQVEGSGESPALFKKGGTYYLLCSNLTSWEKNDNFYFTAGRIEGPWTYRGLFCPAGQLTYNAQTTFVFPFVQNNDTIPLFMGDRWSFPLQASAATYVWLPMRAEGTALSIPAYWQGWDIATGQPADLLHRSSTIPASSVEASPGWTNTGGRRTAHAPGDVLRVPFEGTCAAVVGESNPHGGYARIGVLNEQNDTVYASLVDFYSKYPERAVRVITPRMPRGSYTLFIEVTGVSPAWTDKKKTLYGSDDTFVTIDEVRKFIR